MDQKEMVPFFMTTGDKQRVEQMVKLFGLDTPQQLLEEALFLLTWAGKEVWDQKTIASVDEENRKSTPYSTPRLEYVKNNGALVLEANKHTLN